MNIQEYTILVILNDAGYVRMINLFSACTSGSGWTRPRSDKDVSH